MQSSKVRLRGTRSSLTRKSDFAKAKQDRQDRLNAWARSDAKGNVGEYKT